MIRLHNPARETPPGPPMTYAPTPGPGATQASPLRVRVSEVMTRHPNTLYPWISVPEAEDLRLRAGVHQLPVVDARGELLGLVCRCDLQAAMPGALVVSQLVRPLVFIDGYSRVEVAVHRMRQYRVDALPVVAKNQVVGMITRGDLYRAGFLDEEELSPCARCGSHHHVLRDGRAELELCQGCLELEGSWGEDWT